MNKDFIVVIIETCDGFDSFYTTKAKDKGEAEAKVSSRYIKECGISEERFEEHFECVAVLIENLTIV